VVGSLRFQVPYRAIGALIEGQAYRLYFLPRTHALLSMEPFGAA
jgi:hypothetical protein